MMHTAESSPLAEKKKQLARQIAFAAGSILLIIALILFLLARISGGWLVSKGNWSDTVYNVGRIDYSYEINNHAIDTEEQDFTATVPLLGGVKINDSAAVASSAPNYQRYAEENFNEGVTLAHILITNKSDFQINITAAFAFDDLFDSAEKSQNIFYLILPQGATVDTVQHTVTLPDHSVMTYKNYIKSCMSDYSTNDAIKASLAAHYASHPTLKSNRYTLAAPTSVTNTQLEFNILFWAEYDNNLPYVTGAGGGESLVPPNGSVDSLTGQFQFKMDILQNNPQ